MNEYTVLVTGYEGQTQEYVIHAFTEEQAIEDAYDMYWEDYNDEAKGAEVIAMEEH